MMIDALSQALEARPAPTPERWAAWRRIVSAQAPDLLDMLFGGAS